ncbi:TIGR03643 family protein [Tenacibaculum sp. MAR_2010_89]|uniref:TIGR03643 family protein n=1 Tax=Tenacibaculum sp. MAR_2010_89 TaxID=1250198 RepID=UPI00089C9A4B|nr:TIGR03643 family protein [Tenacibaculum sp. MAR_2010_89]SEE48809.1 TIGR03643 family protein [Tenacibaculum sp. MAR_2010_89]
MKNINLDNDINRIIEMAWEDRTTFDAIKFQFNLKEQDVIVLMRKTLKPSSFKLWRKRVQGRKTKHEAKRTYDLGRFKCSRQRSISNNKISKR